MRKSGAKFPDVIGAIDGILIWIMRSTKAECKKIKVADGLFKSWRTDKFGFKMQAICDPRNASDIIAWTTSSICGKLDDETVLPKMLLKGMVLLGDNAYVKTKYMTIPFKYDITQFCHAYNFYQPQLQINIECTFGVLVRRWAILRCPVVCPLCKVAPLVRFLFFLFYYFF